ncbi:hypothetical protein PCURB6_18380 [Paenibacillus curdlanolyticus]|nr:hypothetical protein PCURB6_18380 [Paenibacillus curdlanolyticus]
MEPLDILYFHSSAIDGDFVPDPTGIGNHSGAYADKKRFEKALVDNISYLGAFRSETQSLESAFSHPYLFIWTDVHGMLLATACPPSMIEITQKSGVVPGLRMEKKVLGLNAVSLAMETGRAVVVRGEEHTINLFALWNCVCCPVRAGQTGPIVGYLDISFDVMHEPGFVVPLLTHVASKIGAAIGNIEED